MVLFYQNFSFHTFYFLSIPVFFITDKIVNEWINQYVIKSDLLFLLTWYRLTMEWDYSRCTLCSEFLAILFISIIWISYFYIYRKYHVSELIKSFNLRNNSSSIFPFSPKARFHCQGLLIMEEISRVYYTCYIAVP